MLWLHQVGLPVRFIGNQDSDALALLNGFPGKENMTLCWVDQPHLTRIMTSMFENLTGKLAGSRAYIPSPNGLRQ